MNDLQRMKKLAGILNEDMNVGGSESDMQTADTANRNAAYAAFDASQTPATESVDGLSTWQKRAIADTFSQEIEKSSFMDVAVQNTLDKLYAAGAFQADERQLVIDFIDMMNAETVPADLGEKAPPGMEKTVKDIKKEYPGHPEKAFATAWSIYNKKHGKTDEGLDMRNLLNIMESSQYQVTIDAVDHGVLAPITVTASTPNEAKQKAVDATKASMIKRGYELSVRSVSAKPVGGALSKPAEPADKKSANLDPSEINSLAKMSFDDAKAKAAEMIAASTTNDTKKSFLSTQLGKARNNMDLVSILYNMFLKGEGHGVQGSRYSKKFDRGMEENLNEDWEIERIKGLTYNQGVKDGSIAAETGSTEMNLDAALELWHTWHDQHGHGYYDTRVSDEMEDAYKQGFADGYGGIEEDLNNGYHDVNVANGSDYFPNGADSPVVDKVGPSGARQGDNPEQKKMQVAEVHKELVYGYRKFLEESTQVKKKLGESALSTKNIKHIFLDRKGRVSSQDLYTMTDGRGNYPLSNDGGVFMSQNADNVHIQSLDGKPHSTDKTLYLFIIDKKLGLYDDNLRLVMPFESVDDFLEKYEDDSDFASPYTIDL